MPSYLVTPTVPWQTVTAVILLRGGDAVHEQDVQLTLLTNNDATVSHAGRGRAHIPLGVLRTSKVPFIILLFSFAGNSRV
jgi:hypothetical protein